MIAVLVDYADCRVGCARVIDSFVYPDDKTPPSIPKNRASVESFGSIRKAYLYKPGEAVVPRKGSIISLRKFVGL